MAAVSGTSTRYSLVGFREDLEDTIWELFPEDTWLLSNLEQVGATSSNHEWQSDSLAAAAANRQIEGDEASFATLAPTVRLNNFQQISRKTLVISGTALASTAAGNANTIGRNAEKLMIELKRDMELALVGNQASSDGGTGTARSSAGMESWIAGPTQDPGVAGGANVIRATTTANAATTPGFAGGTVPAPTDGTTTGALTSQALISALEGAWADGGDPTIIICGSKQKGVIDGFTSVATRFVDVDRGAQASVIGAINVYVSDFGRHSVVLHRYVRTSVVLCIDPSYWAVSFLRRPFMGPLADTGDARKRLMLAEYGLVARAPGTATLSGSSAKVVACA